LGEQPTSLFQDLDRRNVDAKSFQFLLGIPYLNLGDNVLDMAADEIVTAG
jgi:hypothetical protein